MSPDGLLKEPESSGPDCDPENLNDYSRFGYFETEEEAMNRIIEFNNNHRFFDISDYVLLTMLKEGYSDE